MFLTFYLGGIRLSIVISICLILFGTAIIEFLENVLNRMIKDESPVIRGIGYIADFTLNSINKVIKKKVK